MKDDTNGDGLPDVTEFDGFKDGFGHLYWTDPDDSDTDGNGLSDGEEVGENDWVTWDSWDDPLMIIPAPLAEVLVPSESGKWHRFMVTEAAQAWIKDGFSNRGVFTREKEPADDGKYRFISSENTLYQSRRPKLTIVYRE